LNQIKSGRSPVLRRQERKCEF